MSENGNSKSGSPVLPDTITCPFTGAPLRILHSDTVRSWRAEGPFYFTKWYEDPEGRRALMYDLMTRGGRVPDFSQRSTITVRERTKPEVDVYAERSKETRDAAFAHAERILEGR